LRKTCLLFATYTVAGLACLFAGADSARADRVECTLLVDQASGENLLRDGACDRRVTPMSTFKVPLALMGFDAGILTGPHAPLWQYRDEFQAPKRARKAVDPTLWETESILWYSRELTRKLGMPAFRTYVTAFRYGNADVSGHAGADPLTHSWLGSSLVISPDEQAAFIRRILSGEVPVSAKARSMTLSIMPVYASGEWKVYGKTGSGWIRDVSGRFDRSRPVGWFVGWAEQDGRTVVFARLSVDDKPSKVALGPALRDAFLKTLPAVLAKR
jgi:beta-lactamase class D